MSDWRAVAGNAITFIFGMCVAVAAVAWLVLGAPAVGAPIIEVARAVAILSAAILGVAILTWAAVEDEDWSLREAIRFTTALTLIIAILWFMVSGQVAQVFRYLFPK